ncbi:MAG: hypothetical protein WC679_01295 [Bacteroidales bacterium]|jgi:hypothetical protein
MKNEHERLENALIKIEQLEESNRCLRDEMVREASRNIFSNIEILVSNREWYMLSEIAEHALEKVIEILGSSKSKMLMASNTGYEFRLKILKSGSTLFSQNCIDYLLSQNVIDKTLADELVKKDLDNVVKSITELE